MIMIIKFLVTCDGWGSPWGCTVTSQKVGVSQVSNTNLLEISLGMKVKALSLALVAIVLVQAAMVNQSVAVNTVGCDFGDHDLCAGADLYVAADRPGINFGFERTGCRSGGK